MRTFASQVIDFYKYLRPPSDLPVGIDVLFPQQDKAVIKIVEQFFIKFYNDAKPRTLLFGINPGRFGAGTTGVNFTAPRQLKAFCGIDHPFKDQSELSAEFIYEMIMAYGRVAKFYEKFFITSVCPLGFVKDGINLNYYDDKNLLRKVQPFILDCIQQQLHMNVNRDRAYCIGGDKNLRFFSKLNTEHAFFKEIIALPHPRFIMQYRRKRKQEYVELYLREMGDSR